MQGQWPFGGGSTGRIRRPAPPAAGGSGEVMEMLTEEQRRVVDAVRDPSGGDRIIAVNSVAGSGKTSTAEAVIRAYVPKSGFYTAFNKAIVADSGRRFGKLIEARTVHALAYKYCKPEMGIEDFNYSAIRENISYEAKNTVIAVLDNFFRSSSTDIGEYAAAECRNPALRGLICDYAERMAKGGMPGTFNYMLKALHLLLFHKTISIHFDLFILDECQDTTAVTLEIFKLIDAERKVMLGDSFQNIYSYMNTVNAFDLVRDVNLLRLTKSFRCSEAVAEIVQGYGRKYLEKGFVFSGNEKVARGSDDRIAYISRSNAVLIERMVDLLDGGRSFSLVRDIHEIFALPLALFDASRGRGVNDKRYKYLEFEYEKYQRVKKDFVNYYDYILQTTANDDIAVSVNLLNNCRSKRINLHDVKARVAARVPDKNVVLSTAHAFKGLEMETVHIEDDLNSNVNKVIVRLLQSVPITRDQKENLNTYYVALSRAKTRLINEKYLGRVD
jgi:superfamily I DNA/RNA helicase